MILIGTRDFGEPNLQQTYTLENGFSTKHVFIESPPDTRPSPNAYLIKQSPDSLLRPHFHHASQFQVFVFGTGKLGRHDVRPYVAHYAGQQTGYGPIIAGPEGLWYFTLRPVTDTGIWYLPDAARQAVRGIPKSQETSTPMHPRDFAPVERTQRSTEVMLERRPDGMGASLLRLAAGAVLPAPSPSSGPGGYYLVVDGELDVGDKTLSELGVVWVSEGEPFHAAAGARGATVIALQFPANAWKYETRPSPAAVTHSAADAASVN